MIQSPAQKLISSAEIIDFDKKEADSPDKSSFNPNLLQLDEEDEKFDSQSFNFSEEDYGVCLLYDDRKKNGPEKENQAT